MIENLAVTCSFIAIFASLITIIIMILVRNNIVHILEKDVVLFDKNFEIKKQAISNALEIIDEVTEYGKQITLRPEFERKAKACYNDLLCVITNVTIADEFYNITLDKNIEITDIRLANFKLLCRNDIGFKTRKAKTVKRIIEQEKNNNNENEILLKTKAAATTSSQNLSASTNATATMPKQNPQTTQPRPVQPRQIQPQAKSVNPVEPVKRITKPKK